MQDKDLTNKGLVFFTRPSDFKNYIADGAISQSFNDKIILDFYVDRIGLPAKAIYDLTKDDEFIEPPKIVSQAKITLEKFVQFSVTLNLKNALELKATLEEAIEDLINQDEEEENELNKDNTEQ